MKLASILAIFLSIMSVCKAQCGSAVNQTNTMFTNVQDGIDLVNNCDFPSQKFNASCVSASCPQLTTPGLCPYTSTKSLNLTALTSILSILNSCFQEQPTICSAPIATIPLPPVGVGLSQVFGIPTIGGQCSKSPNSGSFYNVQNVSFAISPDQSSSTGPLNVVINAPAITITGDIRCAISVAFLNFNLPDINYTVAIGESPTASIDFSSDQPDVKAQADNFTFSFQVGNFAPIGSSSQFPLNLQSLFISGISLLWKSSGNPMAIANFYATFIAFGIEATKGNCGPSP